MTLRKHVLALGCAVVLAAGTVCSLAGCGSSENGDKAKARPGDPNTDVAQRKTELEKALADLEKAKKKGGGCGADGGCCCASAGKACNCSGDKPTASTDRPAYFWSANAVVLTAAPQGHGPWLASSTYIFGAPAAK